MHAFNAKSTIDTKKQPKNPPRIKLDIHRTVHLFEGFLSTCLGGKVYGRALADKVRDDLESPEISKKCAKLPIDRVKVSWPRTIVQLIL